MEINYLNEFQETNKNYKTERQKETRLIKRKWVQLGSRKLFSNKKKSLECEKDLLWQRAVNADKK